MASGLAILHRPAIIHTENIDDISCASLFHVLLMSQGHCDGAWAATWKMRSQDREVMMMLVRMRDAGALVGHAMHGGPALHRTYM